MCWCSIHMSELKEKKCVPCEEGGEPLPENKVKELLKKTPNWDLKGKKIERNFEFTDFKESMQFVNKVADIAEEQGHHPDFHIHYNKVILELWTHSMNGLSENDFVMAAKINDI